MISIEYKNNKIKLSIGYLPSFISTPLKLKIKNPISNKVVWESNELNSNNWAMFPNVEIFGCVTNRLPNTLGCGFEGANGETLLIALDMEGVSVSTGSACSSGTGLPSSVLSAMRLPVKKINSSLRFSLGWGNTLDDMDLVADILTKAVQQSRKNHTTAPILVL